VCRPQEGHCEKRCEIQGGSPEKANNDNSREFVLLSPNSPEFSLLKFLLLAYHQAISWPPPWISHLFSQWPSWEPDTTLQLGCFGLDFNSFCNCILCIASVLPSFIKFLLLSTFFFPNTVGDNLWIYVMYLMPFEFKFIHTYYINA